MRTPLKCRAWDKHLKQYIEDIEFLSSGYWDSDGCPIFMAECEEGDYADCEESFEDNFILEQFTGVKDKNGKEIHDGDICKTGDHIGKVFFTSGCFLLDGEGFLGDLVTSDEPDIIKDSEIIGNINENPELLED